MKRTLTLFTIVATLIGAVNAQISIDDRDFNIKGNPDHFISEVKTYLRNESLGNGENNVTWEVIDMDVPSNWLGAQVCTDLLCITDLTRSYTLTIPEGDKVELKLGLNNEYEAGSGSMTLVAWATNDPTVRDTVSFSMQTWAASVDKPAQAKFKAYPNPTTNYVTIDFTNSAKEIVKVYDILGNELMSEELYTGDRLDISALPKGVYILRAVGETNFSTTIQKI